MARNSVILLKSGTRQDFPQSTYQCNIVLKVLARAIKKGKEIHGIHIVKKEVKFSPFTEDI